MDKNEILNNLGACGINCQKCFAYEKGDIHHHSNELRRLLGDFDVYAQRFVELLGEKRFKLYPEFKEMLQMLTESACKGCRQGECMLKDCGVIKCHKEKGVDFCFECDEFPCDKSNFDEHLKNRWISINRRMQEIGIEKYYEEIKNLPRY